MPSMPYKDRNGETKYSDTFHPISKGAREEAEEIEEYPEPELGM